MSRPYTRLPYLVLAAALALGWNLGGYRLLDPDEGRNAEVAREMAQSNDYLLPRLDGLPYLDKPVVYFAAAAAAMELLGPSEAAARLPAYLFTLASIGLAIWFARRRWGAAAGWLAGLALATMPLVLAYARATIFDSTLAFCTTAAIVSFHEERPVLAWAAMGLGVLTKGPVAVFMPLIVMVPYVLLTARSLSALFPLAGLAAFGVVALPWFLAVSARIPEFARYVFERESIERVMTRSFHRTGPSYYFLPILVIGTFPWIVPALAGVRRWRWAWLARTVNARAQEAILLACWVLGPLLFFTVNQSKLPQYVLPLMPAFAFAAARALADGGIGTAWKGFAGATAALGLVLCSPALWWPAPIALTAAERAAIPPAAVATGVALLASAALLAIAVRSDRPTLGATAYALPVLALPLVSGSLLVAIGDDRSAAPVVRATVEAVGAGSANPGAVLGIEAYPPSLPFYLRRRIDVATETARELTSNYIADYHEKYRALPGSPLKSTDSWRDVLTRCPAPTVFITRAGDHDRRAELARVLPLLAADGRYAAYGPCR